MKKILILGAGTAGTMMANKLRKALSTNEWQITIVDSDLTHYYQPGFLFIPFGSYSKSDVIKPKKKFIPKGVEVLIGEIEMVKPTENKVALKNGSELICPGNTLFAQAWIFRVICQFFSMAYHDDQGVGSNSVHRKKN